MDILQRLKQQATDLTAGLADDEQQDATTITWDSSTSRSELELLLRKTQGELKRVQGMFSDLKEESTSLRVEYGEYRAKVQAWRTQSQTDRDNAKKMIVSLRGCTDEALKQDTFISALQEQIASLKESFRQSTEKAETYLREKELVEHKWQQEFKEYNSKVEAWRADTARWQSPAAPTSQEVGEESDSALRLIQREQEVEQLNKSVALLEQKLASTEARCEELQSKSAEDVKQIQQLIQKHETALQAQKGEYEGKISKLQDGAQEKYVKDLEAELKKWRRMGSSVEDLAATAAEEAAAAVEEEEQQRQASPSPIPRAASEDGAAQTKRLQDDLTSVQRRYSYLETEAAEREQALQELFNENKNLRVRQEQLQEELEAAARTFAEREKTIEEGEEERASLCERLSEVEAATAKVLRSNTALQKEVAQRNETIRKLKLECAGTGAVAPRPGSPTPSSDGGPKRVATGRHTPHRSSSMPAASGSLATMLHWRRIRVPLAVAFLLSFLIFSAVSSRTITQEAELSERLALCLRSSREQARMLETHKG